MLIPAEVAYNKSDYKKDAIESVKTPESLVNSCKTAVKNLKFEPFTQREFIKVKSLIKDRRFLLGDDKYSDWYRFNNSSIEEMNKKLDQVLDDLFSWRKAKHG